MIAVDWSIESDNSLNFFGQAAKILFVGSDPGFNSELSGLFENMGYSVDSCINGEECLNRLSTQHYQLIIMDITLPEIDGLSLLSILRKSIQIPVIMLMNDGAEEERIKGFYHGADDCLTKPFNKTELLLRVWALLRRCRAGSETTNNVFQLRLDGLNLDKTNKTTSVHGKSIGLTPTEFRLLWVLLQYRGDVLKKSFLYQTVLNKTRGRYDRSLDVHLGRVRKKLSAAGWNGDRLRTIHGEGYCLK
ncbi:response regulator transcription factor [Exilibacterium tricleocarpae]|uniref:Response regulator transcription factor n=1 Tax=Exilibacterium tricleocarpae TaxID=2591008 RepID=A0A545TFG5_9GAMM|nr:response regulator transcription factor [Exilibacterium tricleocarpae]TQV75948.1 response regulator transcription factor [Exilibacterium tricleocarpae]